MFVLLGCGRCIFYVFSFSFSFIFNRKGVENEYFLKSQGGWRKMDIANALIKLTKGFFFLVQWYSRINSRKVFKAFLEPYGIKTYSGVHICIYK